MSTVVYNAEQIETALQAMSESIHTARDDAPWAIVGIRRGGEHLANRIAELLSERTGTTIPVGYVDITLYRDDGFGPNDWPAVGVTEIPFELKKYTVVLVDDVLYTGRTVKHYALTTPMEYFAESTEAYLGVNDFYPFVRAELKEHDPRMFELLKKIWGEVK